MKAISLFSGVGGFEIGFERAGIRTVLQAECDPWCLEVLARHWPDVERVTDVRSVGRRWRPQRVEGWQGAIPASAGCEASAHVDLVYGGFPCQDLSVAGKRAGLGGERSGLWHEYARVLALLQPAWVCIENVPGLLSSAGGRDFGALLADLVELGYGLAWAVLDARHFGVPQRRRRLFVVGRLGNPDAAATVLAVCESCGGNTQAGGEAGQDVTPTLDDGARGAGVDLPYVPDPLTASYSEPRVARNGRGNLRDVAASLKAEAGRTGRDDAAPMVLTSDGSPLAMALCASDSGYRMDAETENFVVAETVRSHPRPGSNSLGNMIAGALRIEAGKRDALARAMGVRRLTPRECERLMGWPDDWTRYTADGREIPDSHRYRMCGNGVVSTVAEWIGRRLVMADRFMREDVA